MEKKLEEAKDILKEIGMPIKQQNDICAYSLLALAGIKYKENWNQSSNKWNRIHDILVFTKENYAKEYAENTRETVRKNCLH